MPPNPLAIPRYDLLQLCPHFLCHPLPGSHSTNPSAVLSPSLISSLTAPASPSLLTNLSYYSVLISCICLSLQCHFLLHYMGSMGTFNIPCTCLFHVSGLQVVPPLLEIILPTCIYFANSNFPIRLHSGSISSRKPSMIASDWATFFFLP